MPEEKKDPPPLHSCFYDKAHHQHKRWTTTTTRWNTTKRPLAPLPQVVVECMRELPNLSPIGYLAWPIPKAFS